MTQPHHWDERTWLEGRSHGFMEGYEEGRYQGFRTLRSDLLHQLDTLRVDLQLQLLDLHTPAEVLHVVMGLVQKEAPECHFSMAVEEPLPCQRPKAAP